MSPRPDWLAEDDIYVTAANWHGFDDRHLPQGRRIIAEKCAAQWADTRGHHCTLALEHRGLHTCECGARSRADETPSLGR